MKNIVRFTRWIVSAFVTLHVLSLKLLANQGAKRLDRAVGRTEGAKVNLSAAQSAVAIARVSVRECRGLESEARKVYSDTKMACEAEAQHWGAFAVSAAGIQAIASLARALMVALVVWLFDGPAWAIAGLGLVTYYEFAGDIK